MFIKIGYLVMASSVRATVGRGAKGQIVKMVLVPEPWTIVILAAQTSDPTWWLKSAKLSVLLTLLGT